MWLKCKVIKKWQPPYFYINPSPLSGLSPISSKKICTLPPFSPSDSIFVRSYPHSPFNKGGELGGGGGCPTMVIIMSPTGFSMIQHSVVCLNVKELLSQSLDHIWSFSDSNGIRTHNHVVCKWTLNHLARLAKWLSCVVSTYLYGAFDCTLLLCHILVSEWIYTL